MEKIYKNASWDAKKIMNGFKHLLIVCFLFVTGNVWGQFAVTTNGGSGLATSYASLSAAITALNAATISGPVVITCPTGTETAPVGGFNITATGTATNTITIQGNGAANSIITAATGLTAGSKVDAIFKIVGGDYITISGFKMQENSANTTTAVATNNMTEFGVALFLTTATNGAQNNTIQNNTITLGATYQNTFGVFSSSSFSSTNTALAATATTGTNSNNKIYGNTISSVAYGVGFICEPLTATIYETGNDIGGSSLSTANNITYGSVNTAADGGWTRFSALTSGVYFRNGGYGCNVQFNTINSASTLNLANGGIVVSSGTAPTGVTYTTTYSNNTITLFNTGTSALTGIDFGAGISTGTMIANSNTITLNSTSTATNSAAIIGIKANYASATKTCNSNTITINQTFSPATALTNSAAITGITLAGSGTTVTSSSNTITINQTNSPTAAITSTLSSAPTGLSVGAAYTTANVMSNTILFNRVANMSVAGTSTMSGAVVGISATTAITTLNIGATGTGNTITVKETPSATGTSTWTSSVTYVDLGAAAHGTANVVANTLNTTGSTIRSTGALIGVQCNGTVTALYNIKSNNFVVDRVAASGSITFTNQTSSPSNVADTVSNNTITYTNLAGTTTATGISQLGGPSASGVKSFNNNIINISGTHTGTTKAIIWGYSAGAKVSNNSITISCAAPTIIAIDGSGTSAGGSGGVNFNTISLTSSTTSPTSMIGINCASTGPYIVRNNTFSALNLTGIITGSPIISGIAISIGTGDTVSNNHITNIAVGAASSTANPTIDGILISGGTSINVYQNKIQGISSLCTGATGVVNGIRISGGTTNQIYNNLIGNLTASASNNTDAIRGISITSTTTSSTHKIYNNTIYLSGSGGTNFGGSGIFHTSSTTSTTSVLDMQNNMIINNITPSGTGLAVAFRRSAGAASNLANYASTSNKNLFYAGTPGASNLIYSDGTSSAQTMSAYLAGVFTAGTIAPRDANSFTESSFIPATYFVSTTGSNANFLQPASGLTSQAEGGGNTIALCSPDYNGVTRPGGTGTAYDVGAWEFNGVSPAPVLTNMAPSPALTSQCTKAARAISIDITTSAGTITGATLNYSHNGTAQTAITMTNSSGNTWTGTMLAPSTGNATVAWSVTATNSIGLSTTYTGTSYSDEPNTGVTATATASPSTLCAGSNTSLNMAVSRLGTVDVGTATTLTSATTQPTAFCNRWPSYRMQTIYTVAELNTSGLSAGNISAMAFNITSLGDAATNANFTVRIGTTSQNTFTTTSWLAPTFTTVFPAATYTHTASGWQTINFTTPYNWDGISNLVIDIQYDGANASNNSTTFFTATTGNTVLHSDFNGKAAASGVMSTTRLNVRFSGNQSTNPTAYSWSDGSSTIGTTNPLSTTVSGNTTYSVTATVNGCPMTTSTSVNTNVSALSIGTFSATKTTLCSGILDTFTGTFSGGCPPYDIVLKNPSGTSIYTVTDTIGLGFFKSLNLTATGNYTLEITDNAGTLASQSISITVNSLPVVSVSPASASSCGGKVVQLDASPSGASAYKWSVTGSSTSATGLFTTLAASTAATTATANGVTTYAKPTATTSYTVTVTDANGCSASASKSVGVYNAMSAIATTDAQALCPGSGATLKDSASMNLGAASYVFANSTGASLDPMTGATSLLASGIDNTASALTTFPSGFTFPFDGTSFSQFTVSDNGVLRLGSTSVSTTQYGSVNGISNLLTPFGCDMGTGSNGGVSYVLSGTSPNRIFIVDYKTVHTWSTSSPINNNYQIWLYENGTIEYRYGSMGSSGTPSFGIGLSGTSTSNYISVATATGLKSNSTVTSNSTLPTSGTLFSFTPATPSFTYSWSQNGSSTLSSNSGNTVNVSNFISAESFYVTATETTTGCTDIDTVDIALSNGAPNITAMNSSAGTAICYGTNTTLSASFQDGCGPFTYQWDDGAGNTYTTATVSVSPSITTIYSLTITDAQNQTASNNIQIDVSNPMPTITNRTKCTTSDTFKLSATAANSGDSLYWYTVSTGGTSVGVGSNYTTPTISTAGTTTYYVEEWNNTGSVSVSAGNSSSLSTTSTTSSSNGGLVFTTTQANVRINSIDIFVSGSGSMTFELQNSSGTAIATSTQTITGSTTALVNVALPSIFTTGAAAAGYRIICSSKASTITWYYQTGSFPYTSSPSGISITGGYGWTSATSNSTELRCIHKINATLNSFCIGQRKPITITVTTPPSISLSVSSSSVCEGLNDTLSVSSLNTNYSYTWSNSVNGSSNIVAPTSTTTYSVSATDASTGCNAIASTAISVIKKPTNTSAALSSDTVCLGTTVNLSASARNINTIFNEDFEGSFPTTNWTYINNGTGNSWTSSTTAKSGTKAIQYSFNSLNPADAWAISPSISMIAGNTYDVRFYYKVSSSTYPEKLKVTIGSANNVASQSTVLWDNNGGANLTNTTYALGVATFSPSTSGLFNIGFNCYSDLDEDVLYIDSISIVETSSLTYSWTSLPIGFTSSIQNPTSVQDTANKIFNLTVTNSSGCKSYASDTFNVIKSSQNITLASSSVTGAVEQCTESNGWTYYSHPSTPDKLLFGIFKNGNNFTATVDINVDNTNKFTKSASSNGANQEHASYILSRYWNVNATGTVGSGVKVRFFIDPQDITDLLDERDNDYNVLKNNTNPSTLAVTGGFEWFKTTGTTYNPSNWTGNKHNGAIVKLTQDTVGELNGQTYVELSGITSFSGGSGGSSFGPSSNGLFNSGGTVGLPVTWKEVKATAKETGNLIQWATSSEKNTKSFVVEYSYDAKEFFEASKDILAAGNSATERFYEFNHNEEYGELVYYRIKQIDLDGKMEYSKAVVVKRTSKLPEFNVSMYPVPLNVQDLNIRIQTVQKTDISISINDLLGRNVYSETIIPAGYNTNHKMNLSHLPQGTYHVTINNGINKLVQVLVVGK